MFRIDTESDEVTPPPQVQAVNSTTLDVVQLEMLHVIKDLQRERDEEAEESVAGCGQSRTEKR